MSGINTDLRGLVTSFSSKQGVTESVAEAARQEGSLKGQQVVETNKPSSLADAAEEMTFAASEKVEKKLAERKAGSKEAMRLSATELADKYVNMMGQTTNPSKLHEFLESMKKMGGKATEEQLRQLARESFGDIHEQYGALMFAEEALKSEGGEKNKELLATIEATKKTMMQEAGPAIRMGLNIAVDVLKFSQSGFEQIENLRDLYRFSILGRQNANEMYDAIMQRYGAQRFPQALDFLIEAAAHDLDGAVIKTDSAIDKAQLEAAVNNISHVQQLGNLFRVLETLMKQVTSTVTPAHAQ